MAQAFDPYHQWLGIPPEDQPPHYYRLLSVPLFETDPNVIEGAADRQMAHLRTFQTGKRAAACQRLLNEVATARVTLLNAEKKAGYDRECRAELKRREAAGDAEPRIEDVAPVRRPPAVPGAQAPAANKPPPAPTVDFDLPARDLGEYQLTEKLGEGGMGAVYKGVHTKLGREVAVKVLTSARLGSRRAVARFEREMLAVGRLDHPNIVRAYDAREIKGTRFLVMELVDGLDLADVLRHTGPLPVADACEVIRQAALGLQCAHESQLVHRDIKPGNLMLTSTGQVKILDLGVAHFEAAQAGEEMTDTGTALGTLDYMAPEQASGGHHIDIRADVYSLGCTLYKLLSGRAPFEDPRHAGVMEKVTAHSKRTPPAISRFRSEVPKEVAGILNRMLAKDPARRFQTPGAVADALGPFCAAADPAALLARAGQKPPKAAPSQALQDTQGRISSSLTNFLQAITPGQRDAGRPGPAPPRRKQLALGAAAAVAVAVLAVALVWAMRRAGPADAPTAAAPAPERPEARESGALVVRLPDADRDSTELLVDGAPVPLPESEPWEIARSPGTYRVRLVREGFEPYEQTVRIAPGRKVSLEPEWVPEAALVLDWPVDEREDARLRVDGDRVPLPSGPDEPDELHVVARPGTRLVWADRRGYLPFTTTVELGQGEQRRVTVEWEAATGAAVEDMAARPPEELPPEPEPERRPQAESERERKPEPVGPAPEELAALEALEAAEATWREATRASAEKAAAWDFVGALAALDDLRFDDEALTARLARRKDELTRMAALKERMIAQINTADPPLTKSDLMLRGFAGELTGADRETITATLATGKEEALPWHDLGTQAPGRLLQLVVDRTEADDWLSAGVFAMNIGDVELAERLLARAGEMGVDIGPYRGPLAQAAFDAARAMLDAGEFSEAADTLTAMKRRHSGTGWLVDRAPAVAAARAAAEQGVREAEAEQLYAEAVEYFENERFFDVRPLVKRLQAEYAGTEVVTGAERTPPFTELKEAVADLGRMFTVRQDGEGDFETIQAAIDAAPPNSLIEIQDNGPYSEAVAVNKAGITLRGRKGNWPIITSAGLPTAVTNLVAVSAHGVQIEQVVIVHTHRGRSNPSTLKADHHRCRVSRAVVQGPVHVGHSAASRFDHVFFGALNNQVRRPNITNSFVIAGATLQLRGGSVDNCLVRASSLNALGRKIELRQSTILGPVGSLGEGSIVSDSIVPSIQASAVVEIECCNVHGRPPFTDEARPGEGCFSAKPMFVNPKNFDYRLVPGTPGTGMASDGGDVGVRYTPEMIEMLKVALELRGRGIIKF